MPHNSSKDQAAVTAASFSLMLLHAYYSSEAEANPIVTALKTGLTENRTNAAADDLIEELAGGKRKLAASPEQLAERSPDACIKLGELFAQALKTGAEDGEMAIIRKAVKSRQSYEVSSAFAQMQAPALATLFSAPALH